MKSPHIESPTTLFHPRREHSAHHHRSPPSRHLHDVAYHRPAPASNLPYQNEGTPSHSTPASSSTITANLSSNSPDNSTSLHLTSHTDRFGTFFTSNWNTSFLLTVAPYEPWRGGEVYVEVPDDGASCVASMVSSIPIDAPSGHSLMRIDGPKPLWFHSKPTKVETADEKTPHSPSPSPSPPSDPAPRPEASTSALAAVTDMPPPPEETYASGELAVASAQQFALEHGYKLAIVRSSANEGLRRWDLRCHQSRGGRLASAQGQSDEGEDVRGVEGDAAEGEEGQQAQPQVGCKFAVAVRPVKGRWQLKVTHATHHGHDKDVNILANQAKKLTPDEKLLIARLYGQDSNVRRAKIFETLNKRRKEQSKVLLSDPVLISRQLRQLRNLRKEGQGRQATAVSTATSERPHSSSASPSATSPSSSAALLLQLEGHVAQDFQQSLLQQLGCPLPRIPEDHDARITAAAQLYLSSTSLAHRRKRVRRSGSATASASS